MLLLVYMIALYIYWQFPVPGKLISILINLIVPDPVPYLDEIVMTIGLAKHFKS